MKKLIATFLTVSATPALAASGPFFSLHNTNFVVLLAFLLFIAVLMKAGVPGKIGAMLDARAAAIKANLEEARALRDEAKALLASYDAKHKEVLEQSARIIATAKDEAQTAADHAKEELAQSIARRLTAAQEQITAAEEAALRQVRESAIAVAVAAAGEVLAKQKTEESAAAAIDTSIAQVEAKFH